MMANGIKIQRMVMVLWNMKMETYTKENGLKDCVKVKEFNILITMINMMVNGIKI